MKEKMIVKTAAKTSSCDTGSNGDKQLKSSRELPGDPVSDTFILITENDKTLNQAPVTLAVVGLKVSAPGAE